MALAKGYPAKREIHNRKDGGKILARGAKSKKTAASSKKRAASSRKKSK